MGHQGKIPNGNSGQTAKIVAAGKSGARESFMRASLVSRAGIPPSPLNDF